MAGFLIPIYGDVDVRRILMSQVLSRCKVSRRDEWVSRRCHGWSRDCTMGCWGLVRLNNRVHVGEWMDRYGFLGLF